MTKRLALVSGLLVSACNRAPNAHAGFDQFSLVGSPVTLDASRSDDPDGDSLGYHWEVDSESVTLSSTSGKRVEATANEPGEFEIKLRVSDGSESSSDRTVLRSDLQPHVLVGSTTPGAPVLEFTADFQPVREFVSYYPSYGLEQWPLMMRRAPDGTILVLEQAEYFPSGCQGSVERYSSGGEHMETVYPRGGEPSCTTVSGAVDPSVMFETDEGVFIADGFEIKVLGDRQIVEEIPIDVQLLGGRDLVVLGEFFYVSIIVTFGNPAGIAEVDRSGNLVRYVVSSSGAPNPGRMDVSADGRIAASNYPDGIVFTPAGGIGSTFASDGGGGVAFAPDESIFSIVGQSIAVTSSSGTVVLSGPLVEQNGALALIF